MKLGVEWVPEYGVWWIKHPESKPNDGFPWPIQEWIDDHTVPGGTDAVLRFVQQQLRELQ